MDKRGEAHKGGLETIQRHIEEAAKKVAHTTKSERARTPEEDTMRERAAARSTRLIERKVL